MPSPTLRLSNEGGTLFPLSMSSNKRYLLRRNGEPVFLMGSAHQGMMFVPTSEMEQCILSRKAHGVHALIVQVLLWGLYGDTSQNTYDSINPFTTSNDISTPNSSYFARLDAMLDLMKAHNMIAFLVPYPTKDDWMGVLRTNGGTKATNFGSYLGSRYAGYNNVIWTHGNDFQTWATGSDNLLIRNIHDGIASQASQWQTIWEDYYTSDSLQDGSWQDSIPNLAYSYYPQYQRQITAYNRTVSSHAIPALFFEGHYEDEDYMTYPGQKGLRAQEWWTFLSGACGSFYGQNEQFRMKRSAPAWNAAGWDSSVEWQQFRIFNAFVNSYRWYDLVPDQTNVVLTAGLGTYTSTVLDQSSDYATCAALADGTLAIIYMPSNRTMTVDMTKFSGTVTARWFDPVNGTYTNDAASPLSNSGTHNFSRATTNSNGESDWVLVLTA